MTLNIIKGKFSNCVALIGLLLMIISCAKQEMQEDEMPGQPIAPLSQTGKNEVGFRIDGEPWISRVGGSSAGEKEFVMDTLTNTFYVMAYYDAPDSPRKIDYSLTIRWLPNTKLCDPGSLNRPQFENMTLIYDHKLNNNCSAFRNIQNYTIEIKDCDYISRKIVGNYEFEVANVCGEVRKVTLGYFNGQFKFK